MEKMEYLPLTQFATPQILPLIEKDERISINVSRMKLKSVRRAERIKKKQYYFPVISILVRKVLFRSI